MADETQGKSTPAFDDLAVIDLKQAAAGVQEAYKNFVLADVNDHCVRMAVMEGEYPWHYHPRSDECFLTLEGCLEIDLTDGRTNALLPGNSSDYAAMRVVVCFRYSYILPLIPIIDP